MGEPLCTFSGYEEFKSMGDEKDEERQIEMIRTSFERMPALNRDTFRALLRFLGHVAVFQEDNKMSPSNLAIVFAPNLFKPFEMTQNDMIYAVTFVKLLTKMIHR